MKRSDFSYDPVMRDILEKKAFNTGKREDVEKAIAESLKGILELYKKFNPDGDYISLCAIDDTDGLSIMVSNAEDRSSPLRIDVWELYGEEDDDDDY